MIKRLFASFVLCLAALSACTYARPSNEKIVSIQASSTLHNDARYGPRNVIDGTWRSWAEGAPGDGIGESLTITFGEKIKLTDFYIKNGHGLKKYFKENNRVKRLNISSDRGDSTTVQLKDSSDIEKVIMPDPVTGTVITFTIAEVYTGVHYSDTCIAEILFAEPPTPVCFPITDMNNSYGYFDRLRGVVIDCKYRHANPFSEGLACVCDMNNKHGYIDVYGKTIIDFQFTFANSFREGLAYVANFTNDNTGTLKARYVNTTGRTVFDLSIPGLKQREDPEPVYPFHERAVIPYITRDGSAMPAMAIFDKQGKKIILKNYHIENFSEGRATFKKNEQKGYGYIDYNGVMAINNTFEFAGTFKEGLAPVIINKKWGYINKQGAIIIKCRYDAAYTFSENAGLVMLQGKYFFIDKKGSVLFNKHFEDARSFSENRAAIKIRSRWGFIDAAGQVAIQPIYSYAYDFKNGLARVMEGAVHNRGCVCHPEYFSENEGYIDQQGNYLWRRDFQ